MQILIGPKAFFLSSPKKAMEMLKFLTHKLRQQSLNEQAFQHSEVEDDRDSGTESDEENAELEALERAMQEREEDQENRVGFGGLPLILPGPIRCSSSPTPSSTKRPLQLVNFNPPASPFCPPHYTDLSWSGSGHSSPQSSSDFERCSLDFEPGSTEFERHSSEEELAVINCNRRNRELQPEKRKWHQANRCGSYSESSGSSDEEVRDLLTKPKPLKFSASPPKGVHRLRNTLPPRLFLAHVVKSTSPYTHNNTCMVSPRKRHRQTLSRDVSEATTVIQRPCLDFEKMQVGLLGMNLIY